MHMQLQKTVQHQTCVKFILFLSIVVTFHGSAVRLTDFRVVSQALDEMSPILPKSHQFLTLN